jgi:hypothetical protein
LRCDITPEEVHQMFGDEGNYEDYWLGQPHYTNTFIMDNVGWTSAEEVLKGMQEREQFEWNAPPLFTGENRDTIRKIIADEPNAVDRAGGIMDISPEFHHVRSRLLARGRLAHEMEMKHA